ncbi:cyclophilin-like fold protein [Nakamurella sp. GG22]
MRRGFLPTLFAGISTAALLAACGSSGSGSPVTGTGTNSTPAVASPSTDTSTSPSDRSAPGTITVSIGSAQFPATLADTATARAFAERLPLTLDMADVNGNEKAFELADALPADATIPGTVRRGDLMLYGSDTVVLFYESFDASYAYTRIGRLDAPDSLAGVLGAGDVTVSFAQQ